MTFISDIQRKVDATLNRFGTSVKITTVDGKSKSTVGVISEITSEDLADSFISRTDKVVFLKGTMGLIINEGDVITFVKSKRSYTVIKTALYNIDDVAANSMAQKLYVRP